MTDTARAPEPAYPIRRAIAIAIGVSVVVHVGVATLVSLLILFGGGLRSGGEDGRLGAGSDTLAISIAGPEADRPPAPKPPAAAPKPAPTLPKAKTEAPPKHARAAHRRPAPDTSHDGVVVAEAHPAPAPTPASAPAAPPAPAVTGTNADQTSTGRAPHARNIRSLVLGTAGLLPGDTGHRALLADALTCHDPVVGTWVVQKWSVLYDDWARFQLHIHRHGDMLSGTITSRMWGGGPEQAVPPPCAPGMPDYTVSMRAHGYVDGRNIDFGAQSYHIIRARCVVLGYGYNPDHFTGTLDDGGEIMHTVNNDGGRDVNAPYTFHRTSCDPGDS